MSTIDGGKREVPRPILIACAILAAEALVLIGLGGFEVYSTVFGTPSGVLRALLGAAFAFGGALALLAGARGLMRLNVAARTPMLVIQLLFVPVSYSLAFQAERVGYGAPILIGAISIIYLLFTPPAREALDRDLTI